MVQVIIGYKELEELGGSSYVKNVDTRDIEEKKMAR